MAPSFFNFYFAESKERSGNTRNAAGLIEEGLSRSLT